MLLLLACTTQVAQDAPECTDVEVHSCPAIEIMHSCNQMFAIGGLEVLFDGYTLDTYDATVMLDDAEIAFTCAEGTPSSNAVWSCDEAGFRVTDWANVIDITVTGPDASYTGHFEPCWTATEPNGECCGWTFNATVTLEG